MNFINLVMIVSMVRGWRIEEEFLQLFEPPPVEQLIDLCSSLEEHWMSRLTSSSIDDDESRGARYFELTTTLLKILYHLIGHTGHSPKSLQLARQMNDSPAQLEWIPSREAEVGHGTCTVGTVNSFMLKLKLQDEIPESVPFPCPTNGTRSKKRPTRADRVRPGDIDVIAALGDSLVAANGAVATNLFQVLIANRGVSWAIGGQETWRQYLTLPNIIKEFNPQLVGYSTGDSLYSANREHSQLNVAEPAARSEHLPTMAEALVARLQNHPFVNVKRDWKMITIFIGAMDFCFHMCFRENPAHILEEHRRYLTEALLILKENSPRTIVNVVLQPNLGEIIPKFYGLPWLCETLYKSYECPCLVSPRFHNQSNSFRSVMAAWQEVEEEVVNDRLFKGKKDFAVVAQPFFLKTDFPKLEGDQTDMRFLSHDCFHPSQLGHARAASALWNNIMEPIGQKTTTWDLPFLKLKCPTIAQPFIPVK